MVGTVDGDSGSDSFILSIEPQELQRTLQRVARSAVSRKSQSQLRPEDYQTVADVLLMNARGMVPSLERCLDWPVEQMLGARTPAIGGLSGSLQEFFGRTIAEIDHCGKLGSSCLFEYGYNGTVNIGQWEVAALGKRAFTQAQHALEDLMRDRQFRKAIQAIDTPEDIDQEPVRYERCAGRFEVYAQLLGGFKLNIPEIIDQRNAGREASMVVMPRPEETRTGTGQSRAEAKGSLAAAPALLRAPERVPASRQQEGVYAMLGVRTLHRTGAEAEAEEKMRILNTVRRMAMLRAMDLTEFRQSLERRLIGQPEAVQTIVDHFQTWRGGTHDPLRPFGMLCIGPTGVGKTYTAEVLRDVLADRSKGPVPMRTINGAEFSYASDINELKGAARGFIRSDEEGIMAKFYSEAYDKPFSVFVVDELTKGHPQLRHFLMSLLDRGIVTDNRGKDLQFYGTIFVLTSNVGYSEAEGETPRRLGFGSAEDVRSHHREDALRRIRKYLSSEFLNRVYLVPYESLTFGDAERIFDLELDRIAKRYQAHGVMLECDLAARDYLLRARMGFSEKDGARKLNRVLSREVNAPLSKMIDARIRLSQADADELCDDVQQMLEGKRAYDLTALTKKLQPPQDLLIVRLTKGTDGLVFDQRYR